MYTLKDNQPCARCNEVCYYVISSRTPAYGRSYGILAVSQDDKTLCEEVENLFLTEKEAQACCNWLSENEVYPLTICEVLHNVYSFLL